MESLGELIIDINGNAQPNLLSFPISYDHTLRKANVIHQISERFSINKDEVLAS